MSRRQGGGILNRFRTRSEIIGLRDPQFRFEYERPREYARRTSCTAQHSECSNGACRHSVCSVQKANVIRREEIQDVVADGGSGEMDRRRGFEFGMSIRDCDTDVPRGNER